MNAVKTIDWMLEHKGLAVAKAVNGNKSVVEIIKYSEKIEDYPDLKEFAKQNDYLLVVGKDTVGENRLGYFRHKL